MADGLSVAGTAVGIMSLGIQVCQGLISYVRSAKKRKKELADTLKDIQALLSIFYSLQDIIPLIDQSNPIDSLVIRNCLKDSEEGLQELNALVTKLKGQPGFTKITEKAKETGRALIYPFHEGKLISVRESIRRILANLNLVIDNTTLYVRRLPDIFDQVSAANIFYH